MPDVNVVLTDNSTIIRGNDYLIANNRPLVWTSSLWPALWGATITFTVLRNGAARLTVTGFVLTASSVRVELTDVDTGKLKPGAAYTYVVDAVIEGLNLRLVDGDLKVRA